MGTQARRQTVVVPAPQKQQQAASPDDTWSYHKLGVQEADWLNQVDPNFDPAGVTDRASMAHLMSHKVSASFSRFLVAAGIFTLVLCVLLFGIASSNLWIAIPGGLASIPAGVVARKRANRWRRGRGYLMRLQEELGDAEY